MRMNRFSIITICFNEVEGIRSTCESVLAQRGGGFEWIVIDGGSTDGALDILQAYAGRMACFVSEPDGGIYDAMNKGIARAQGDYVVFMNAGDRFASDSVLQQVAAVVGPDLIYGDICWDSDDGSITRFPDQVSLRYFLDDMLGHQATFYRRELFERIGDYDTSYRIAGDYEWNVRLFASGDVSTCHVAEPFAVFSLGGVSSNKRMRRLKKQENHRVRKQYYPAYRWSLKCWRQELRGWLRAEGV